MSGGTMLERTPGTFEEVFPLVSLDIKSLAAAIRADGIRIGRVTEIAVTARAVEEARSAAVRLIILSDRFLASLPPEADA